MLVTRRNHNELKRQHDALKERYGILRSKYQQATTLLETAQKESQEKQQFAMDCLHLLLDIPDGKMGKARTERLSALWTHAVEKGWDKPPDKQEVALTEPGHALNVDERKTA